MELKNELQSEVKDCILARIKDEFNACFLYRILANYARLIGYIDAHNFFTKEAEDEYQHAHILQHYLSNRGESYDLPLPDMEFSPTDFRDCFKKAYKAESNLYEAYQNDSVNISKLDKGTHLLFNKMIEIQIESMAEYRAFLMQLSSISDDDLFFWQEQKFSIK